MRVLVEVVRVNIEAARVLVEAGRVLVESMKGQVYIQAVSVNPDSKPGILLDRDLDLDTDPSCC
jgi:hypothetical protein